MDNRILFDNRQDAGRKLAERLTAYEDRSDVVVIGLPRGGIEVGYYIAEKLHLSLDFVPVTKIGSPLHPELAIGAVSLQEEILDEEYIELYRVPKEYLDMTIQKGREKLHEQEVNYRKKHTKLIWKDKVILLVDDGLATGFTMLVACRQLQKEGAREILPVIPVASTEGINLLKKEVKEVVSLHISSYFYAIGQFYKEFLPIENEKVEDLLSRNRG